MRISAGLFMVACLAAAGCATVFPPRGAEPLHPVTPPGAWHVVRRGETPASIAAESRIALEDFLEINGLRRGDGLTVGQLVFVLAPQDVPASAVPDRAAQPDRLRWPLQDPRLSSAFGVRSGRAHEGIDLAAPVGTSVFAAESGEVIYAGDGVRGYGNMVVVQHAGDLMTVYAHNSRVLVKPGDRVLRGQEIARVGATGRATAPHLHFEVRDAAEPRDPLRYLPAAAR